MGPTRGGLVEEPAAAAAGHMKSRPSRSLSFFPAAESFETTITVDSIDGSSDSTTTMMLL